MHRVLLFFILAISFSPLKAWTDPRDYDYDAVDNLILEQKPQSPEELAGFINKNFSSENEKFRAVFRWVTDNISYSYSYSAATAQEVFKSKKAVCNGYAELICLLCNLTSLKCRKVTGIVKPDYDYLKYHNDSAHAWNIVTMEGREYLADATWSAGTFDNGAFHKEFNEIYFLTIPETFILNHFPDNAADQLLGSPISKSDFQKAPYFCEKAINYEVTWCSPSTSIIKTNTKTSTPFQVSMNYTPAHASIEILKNINDDKPSQADVVMKITDNQISFNLQFSEPGSFFLCIRFDEQDAIYYQLEVSE